MRHVSRQLSADSDLSRAPNRTGLPADAQPAANWSLYRYIYTGNGRAPDNVYNAALQAAADFIVNDAGVRGVYLGAGIAGKNPGKGSLATAAGVTGMWTVDGGATASIDVGFGLQDRGRGSDGQFTSQTIGLGGGYQFWSSEGGFVGPDRGIQYSGIYGGGANRQGGGNFGYDTAGQTFMLGLNSGPVYGGVVIDVNRMSQNIADSIMIIFGGGP